MSNRIFHVSAASFVMMLAANVPPSARAQAELPASFARYEIRQAVHTERLDIVRTAARIEHRYVDRAYTEVWQRNPSGDLEHWKVFLQEARSVHYTPGDLRTVHVQPAWEQLATMIDPRQRSGMTRVRTRRGLRGTTSVLEGRVDGQSARVIWNEQRGWAEEIVIRASKQRTAFRLVNSDTCDGDRCKATDLQAVREIEFADLGDSERDPFVRRFLTGFARHTH